MFLQLINGIAMKEKQEVVPFEEAFQQVQVSFSRLALLHLGFSKVLVDQFGEEQGKELIVRSIMEYGRLIEEYSKHTDQDHPFYGIHDKYVYKGEEFLDTRDIFSEEEEIDFSSLEIHDCSLAKVFNLLKEEELGKLYCYIDAAHSMANDSSNKAIHTKNILCGDSYCQIKTEITTEKERKNFKESDKNWKYVDPILI